MVELAESPVHAPSLDSIVGIGMDRKRSRTGSQEQVEDKVTDLTIKKRRNISRTTLTSIRQNTLTDYLTIYRQPGEALILHRGPGARPDSDSLSTATPACGYCTDSLTSEIEVKVSEECPTPKRTRTNPQGFCSTASSNSLEYDKHVIVVFW